MIMVKTRSGEVNSDGCTANDESLDIEDILNPLKASIASITQLLDAIEIKFEKRFKRQDSIISNLLTRVADLEKYNEFTDHRTKLNARKVDDAEQFSKTVNLRIEGIVVEKNDSPAIVLQRIKDEVNALNLNIPDYAYDKCHRNGPKRKYNGKTYQSVLLKMCFWKDRNTIYQRRKDFNFKVYPHLTSRRKDIFDFATKEVKVGGEWIDRIVDFVFIDMNCKIKMRTKSGKFYGFNSC